MTAYEAALSLLAGESPAGLRLTSSGPSVGEATIAYALLAVADAIRSRGVIGGQQVPFVGGGS